MRYVSFLNTFSEILPGNATGCLLFNFSSIETTNQIPATSKKAPRRQNMLTF